MLGNNGRRVGDYQLVVKKYVKRNEGTSDSYDALSSCLYDAPTSM
jgi:hypothetical protein